MLKRAGGLGRAVVVAVVGIVFALAGVVGESSAQSDMKKGDKMKMDDTMKSGDTMMKGEKDMKKDDKMMQGDKTMEKKQ